MIFRKKILEDIIPTVNEDFHKEHEMKWMDVDFLEFFAGLKKDNKRRFFNVLLKKDPISTINADFLRFQRYF